MEQPSEESLNGKDCAWGAALGVLAAVFSWWWGCDGLPPEVWEDVAVAAGLRPPVAPFPCLWHVLAAGVFRLAGLPAGLAVLHLLGPLALGGVAAMAFLVFHELLPRVLRLRMQRAGWSRFIVRVVLAQGVVSLVCAEPVWCTSRFFSPVTLQLLLTVVSALLFVRAFRLRSMGRTYAATAVLGVLAAETPVGLVIPLALAVFGWWKGQETQGLSPNPFANPLIRALALRRLTYAFLAGFIPAAVANAIFFCGRDGLAAHDWSGVMYVVGVISRYARLFVSAASPVGWLFAAGFVGVPLVLATVLVGKATDDDRFLPYRYGLFFVLAGVVAFLQVAGWRTFWFWTWTSPPCVASGYLLCLCAFGSALTLTFTLCVLGVEIYFRNYRRIAETRYEDALEEPAAARMTAAFRPLDRVRRVLIPCEPLLLLALLVPFRVPSSAHRMIAVLDAFTRRTAEECGDATRLFTDGALDAGIEVAAAVRGRALRTVSMMSGNEPREIYLRMRDAADEEDRGLLATGAADAMRTWVRAKPGRMDAAALQLGFELWRHDKLPMPVCGGFIARPGAHLSPDEVRRGASLARALAARVLELYKTDDPMAVTDHRLRELFLFVQWRLARMCRMRADALDGAGRTEEAMAESRLADALDLKNASLARLRRQMDWVGLQKGARLTLREGLKIGLDRADFRLARTYAQQVLAADPNDSSANFAIGMGYFVEEQYGRAEVYLKRCLAARPDEPAALNNLAIALLRQGRYAEAETNALHALRVLPGSKAVRQTVDAIREKAKAAQGK